MKRFLPDYNSYAVKYAPALCPAMQPTVSCFQHILSRTIFTIIICLAGLSLFAQADNDAAYKKVITGRSAKIINTLQITDSATYYKVLDIMVAQYAAVNTVHDENKKTLSGIKAQEISKEAKDAAIKKQEEKKSLALTQLHDRFIAQLKQQVSGEQLDKIKDGMTYRVFPITYEAYQDMLPGLTGEQKEKIYDWLKEARELAMDEGSSDDKHKVFGKYKGRINNYLSAQGYDLKKETAAWQQRIKERNAAKNEQAQ